KTEVERLRDRLVEKVAEQAKEAEDFYAYYKAEHQAPAIRSAYSKSYDLLLDMSNSPFGRLVVDAIAERLEVIGGRATNDEVEDVAWTILRRNRIDAYQALVHRDALITGRGFVSV